MTESKLRGKKPPYVCMYVCVCVCVYIYIYKPCLPDIMSFPTKFTYSKCRTPRVL